MALDRLLPISTTPGAVTGDSYMNSVQEEVTGLWDRAVISLTGVSGTNTILATATPALTGSLVDGMNFVLQAAATNTTAVTLNINSLGAVAVVDAEGTALAAGALRINAHYLIHYDSGFAKFVVVSYTPTAAIPVGRRLLCYQAVSGAGSIDFANGVSPTVAGAITAAFGTTVLDNTYDSYELAFNTLKPASDDVDLYVRIGTGGGPTYQTTGYEFAYTLANAGGITLRAGTAQAAIIIGNATGSQSVGSAAGENINGSVRFSNPENTDFMNMQIIASFNGAASSVIHGVNGAGQYSTAVAITGLRLQFESGNISSGSAALYGNTKTS